AWRMTVRTRPRCCAPDFARGISLAPRLLFLGAPAQQPFGPAFLGRTHDLVALQPDLTRLRLRFEEVRSPRLAMDDLPRSRHAEALRRRAVRLHLRHQEPTLFFVGANIIVMFRPSSLDATSTVPRPSRSVASWFNSFSPNSGCRISRARNITVTFTLCPS